ncbi:hypothetical protein OPIT5_00015 (plasmid) [Opitutaceae bacterium TAV5]|nr:hypothetical protein OPIT5_00015 [Opitutaceae bacterium TAV5]
MTRSEKFSDVVDLVNGRELVVWGRGANGEYPMILAPVGTKERIHDGKTYKNLQVVAALAEFARGADPRKDVPRAFLINSIEDGKLSETRNVKCYRCVSAKHPGSRSVYLPIRVENAVEAVRSLASGKPYSFELDDFRISLEGIDIVPAKAGPVKVLRFRAESLQQENAHENSAPLPQRQTPERRSRAL